MLLAFDIGNTNITIGCFEADKLIAKIRLKTEIGRTSDEFAILVINSLREKLKKEINITKCVISSVAPTITPKIKHFIKEYFKIDPLIVGPGVKTGISIKVNDPATVGSDRIVNAVASKELYDLPAITIDFGTAMVVDYIDEDANFKGGVIIPGPETALQSLSKGTAKLPVVEYDVPEKIVGKNTKHAIQSGVFYGWLAIMEGFIDRFQSEYKPVKSVIVTGGVGEDFARKATKDVKYDPFLTLKGLKHIADTN